MTKTTPTTADLRALIHAATLAPSSHNTQPWLFRIDGERIHLWADRTRALAVNDPHDRELTISCGCALFNMRVAAAAAGLDAAVQAWPDTTDDDLLARVQLTSAKGQPALAALQPAIARRRTYRERFAATPVDAAAVQDLVAAAQGEGATATMLDGEALRLAAAALVAKGDALQWADPSWRRELAAWMHPRRRGDGLSLPALAVPVAQIVVRSFDMGQGVGAKDRQLADESPLLMVVCTETDTPQDWLATGQALQRLLLVAVNHGLQASYLNQPAQTVGLRSKLQELTGGPGFAQLLLRIGAPVKDLPAAPRRALEDVLDYA